MTPDPLDLRATPQRVRQAARAAALSDAAEARAVALAIATPPPREWRAFLRNSLGLLGGALVLAGVVCFVAFNWARIGRYGKFALIELAIIAAVAVAWRKLPRLSGQMALFGAAVLVGPLLAVYGQTYQTGADPYGLFLVWALLIVPWAVLANFAATRVLIIGLLDTSVILFHAQVWSPQRTSESLLIPISIAMLHLLALLLWEWQLRRDRPFFREQWAARAVAAGGFAALLIPWVALVIGGSSAGLSGVIGAVLYAVLVIAALRYYRDARTDRFMLALAGVAAMCGISVIAARLVFKTLELGMLGAIIMAVFVLWQISFGLKLYREASAS